MKLSPEYEAAYRLQDYAGTPAIDGVEIVPLRRFNDDGGSMLEIGRLRDGALDGLDGFDPAQINYSTMEPGVIKAFHVHRAQTDVWFVPEHDRILLVLVDVREGSPTEGRRMRFMLGDGTSRLVRIPPGVAHGCRNLASAPGRIVYLTDLHFSAEPDRCDEGRLSWDAFGAEIWEVSRE